MAKKGPSAIGIFIPVIVAGIMELGKIILAWMQAPAKDGETKKGNEDEPKSS